MNFMYTIFENLFEKLTKVFLGPSDLLLKVTSVNLLTKLYSLYLSGKLSRQFLKNQVGQGQYILIPFNRAIFLPPIN